MTFSREAAQGRARPTCAAALAADVAAELVAAALGGGARPHASESRGSFWPVVSARFLVILMFAQLILTAIHAIRKGVVTASFVALTMPVTWAAHRSFVARFEKQFGVLPLISSAGVDNSDEQKEFQERRATVARLSSVGGPGQRPCLPERRPASWAAVGSEQRGKCAVHRRAAGAVSGRLP